MTRWLYVLLIAVPLAVVVEYVHASALIIFVLAGLGLVPLAGLIGVSTEALAERMGQRVGGLLNATFGNAAEIIIGLAALSAGLPGVVRASISGSIIGNTLLVLGMSMFFGGWKYREQQFSSRATGQYAAMLVLAVIGMAIPSLLATVGESTHPGEHVVRGNQLHLASIGIAIILLICYVAYIAYSIFGLRAASDDLLINPTDELREEEELRQLQEMERAITSHQAVPVGYKAGFWTLLGIKWKTAIWFPIIILAVSTASTAVLSEFLVGAINPLTHQVGLNTFFVGLIILPLVGNAAEHFSAVSSAGQDHMEVSMAITAGSSIQIALLVAPLLVLAGTIIGVPLDLNFSLLEVAMSVLVAGLYTVISLDGVSTWLEGLLLCAFYLILAVGTFFTPG